MSTGEFALRGSWRELTGSIELWAERFNEYQRKAPFQTLLCIPPIITLVISVGAGLYTLNSSWMVGIAGSFLAIVVLGLYGNGLDKLASSPTQLAVLAGFFSCQPEMAPRELSLRWVRRGDGELGSFSAGTYPYCHTWAEIDSLSPDPIWSLKVERHGVVKVTVSGKSVSREQEFRDIMIFAVPLPANASAGWVSCFGDAPQEASYELSDDNLVIKVASGKAVNGGFTGQNDVAKLFTVEQVRELADWYFNGLEALAEASGKKRISHPQALNDVFETDAGMRRVHAQADLL